MIKVLVMYHPEFASKGKFERKLTRIFSNFENFKILFLEDPRRLINSSFNENVLEKLETDLPLDMLPSVLTHAVLFDSVTQPVLLSLYEHLSTTIPTRYIKDKITFVSNKDKGEHFDTYIGRGSLWGNPYAIGHDGDRDDVIRKFEYDFERNYLKGGDNFKEQLKLLRGHTLGCHCKPNACHGDVLSKYLNEIDDGE